MRVNLIRPPNPASIDDMLDEPLGLLYLGATLRLAGYDVRITDLAMGGSWDTGEAEVYCIQLFTPTAHLGIQIAREIRQKYPGALIVAGGPHVSAVDKGLDAFDSVMKGEGEIELPYWLKEPMMPAIIESAKIDDLDSLPFPARDMVDMMAYHRKVDNHRCFGIIGSRGCPHHCVFCDRSLFGSKIRFRSIGNIVDEIKHVIDKYGVRHFEFFDDMFPGTKARLEEFCDKTEGLELVFRCNARADIADFNYYSMLKRAGCNMLYFGIESGVQEILDLMKKGTTVEKNLQVIKTAQDAGLKVGGYFILGFPGETPHTIEQTLKFVEKSGLDQAQFYMFIPLPGSEVYKNLDKYGARLLTTDYSEYYHVAGTDGHGGRVVETDWLSADEMQEQMQMVRAYLRGRGSSGGLQDYYKEKLKYRELPEHLFPAF